MLAHRAPGKLNQQSLLEALGGLGFPSGLMQPLRENLAPPLVPEKPSKRSLDLEIKLDKIQKERERLLTFAPTKQEEFLQAQCQLDDKEMEVQEVHAIDGSTFRPVIRIRTWLVRGILEDDAYLGSNHQKVQNSNRLFKIPLGRSNGPDFDQTLAALQHFDHNQIEQLVRVAQVGVATKASASQPRG